MRPAEIPVSWSTVDRTWRRAPGDDIFITLRTSGTHLEQFARAVGSTNDIVLADSADIRVIGEAPAGVSGGYVVSVRDAESLDELKVWVSTLAAELQRIGLDGRIGVAPSWVYPRWMQTPHTAPVAFVAWDSGPGPASANGNAYRDWRMPTDRTERIAGLSAQWTQLPDAQCVLHRDSYSLAVDPKVVRGSIVRSLIDSTPAGVSYVDDAGQQFASASLYWGGDGVFKTDGGPIDWRGRITTLTKALTALPSDARQAYVRPSYQTAISHLDIVNVQELPGISEPDLRYNKHLLDRYLPDAHGVQLVQTAHLEAAHDLSAWHISDLGHGRHLVQAQDLAPWYSTELPDPDVVDHARADFAGALITKQIIIDNPAPVSSTYG